MVEELNRGIGKRLAVKLDLRRWEDVAPGMGRAEDVILEKLPVETWDLFIGILWLRFGSPSGVVDPDTGQPYQSGTEEEFKLAYRMWLEQKKPNIMVYRCTRSPEDLDDIDDKQLKLVRKFF